jgi:hypothetical protein
MKQGAVLIRSPPFSGKTSLRVLLANWCLRHRPELRVFHISLLPFGLCEATKEAAAAQWNSDWKLSLVERSEQPRTTSWEDMVLLATPDKPVFVIVDEAQLAYRYSSDFPFWKRVKRALELESGLHFLLLAGANLSQEPGTTTPVQFREALGFDVLKLQPDERKYIFDAACNGYGSALANVMQDEGMRCCVFEA